MFASFADAGIVEQAKQAGIGKALDVRLGASHGNAFGEPVPVRVAPVRFTDGRYRETRSAGEVRHVFQVPVRSHTPG